MSLGNVTTRTVIAVLVATTAALIFRSWLQIELLQGGASRKFGADLSYLAVPPILALLLFPLWRSQKSFLATRFARRDLTWNVVLHAVTIGLLLRLFTWSQLVAGVSFGIYRADDPHATVGPIFSFQCGTVFEVILGFVVMAIMVPVIEEVIHRGFVVSFLRHRGQLAAIGISAIVFMVFHSDSSWPIVFLVGLVFGYQYWHSHTLWPSLFAHMTVNGLIQVDWHCLSGQWNPVSSELPSLIPGISSSIVMLACGVGIVALLSGHTRGRRIAAGRGTAPRNSDRS